MSNQMKLIMESWRKKVLQEDFSDEVNWNKGKDSDFGIDKKGGMGSFTLFILNPELVDKPYPKPDGQNHGLVSHAIKHAREFKEIPIDNHIKSFKQKIEKLYNAGKDIYIRIPIKGKVKTYKMNKSYGESLENLKNEWLEIMKKDGVDYKTLAANKDFQTLKKYKARENQFYNKELPKIANEMIGNSNKVNYKNLKDTFVKLKQKIANVAETEFFTFLDFHHDLGLDKLVDVFDGQLIDQYSNIINKTIANNKEKIKTSKKDSNKKALVDDNNTVIITYGNKISTGMRVKGTPNVDDYLS
tara:strand:+ start:701 stop:1600 length:900 start_codon:yes stop_codon:yes gene_type:complete